MHGRDISIDYRLNFKNIREEGIVVTIEEAPKIIYDKTLVRCIIWVSRASRDLKICDPNKFDQESKEYVANN